MELNPVATGIELSGTTRILISRHTLDSLYDFG